MLTSKHLACTIFILGVLFLSITVHPGFCEEIPEKTEQVDQEVLAAEEKVNKGKLTTGVEHDVLIIEHGSYDIPASGTFMFVAGIHAMHRDGKKEAFYQLWFGNASNLPRIGERYDLYYEVRELYGKAHTAHSDWRIGNFEEGEKVRLITGYEHILTGEKFGGKYTGTRSPFEK